MIQSHMKQICEIIPTSKDKYGKWIEGTPIPTKCRVKEEVKMVKNKAAEQVVSSIEFWFMPDIAVKVDDLINLNGKKYPIISVSNKRNLSNDTVLYKVVMV